MTPRSFIVGIIKKYPLLVFLALIASFSGALFNSVSVALIVPIVLKLLNFSDATLEGGPPILSRILAIADPFPPPPPPTAPATISGRSKATASTASRCPARKW